MIVYCKILSCDIHEVTKVKTYKPSEFFLINMLKIVQKMDQNVELK